MTVPDAARRKRTQPTLFVALAVGLVVIVGLIYIAFGLLTAGGTLGCDYFTYADAATRHLAGLPVYPEGPVRTGECGLYQYPPPSLLLVFPFVVFGHDGVWLWIACSTIAFAAGCAILPVKMWVRLTIFLIGAVGWPLIFGLRIGQVVPLLFFAFAVAWRLIERPLAGIPIAIGTIMKVQPALVLVWMAARLNLRGVAIAGLTLVAISAAAALVGLNQWAAFLRIIGDISQAIEQPVNMSIGATLYRFGVDPSLASAVQTANTAVLLVVVFLAARLLGSTPGYLVAITASQIISPIVWSHYALILLLPVAWLLERRQWWAVVIPLVHVWILLPFTPNWTYPLAYYATLVAIWEVEWRGGHDSAIARVVPAASHTGAEVGEATH